MKTKALVITVIAVVVIISCFVVYNTYSNTEVESEQMAVVFATDKMGLMQVIDEKVDDLYKETLVKAETAGEMSGDIENEEIEDMDAQMYAIQNVNLREGTAVTTTALRTIQFSEQVHVTGISTNKQWYRVEDTDKGTGYVASGYLSDTKPTQNISEAQKSNPSGGGDLTNTTPPPAPSGGPSQSDLDEVNKALAEMGITQTPSQGQTGSSAGEGGVHTDTGIKMVQ